MITGEMGSGKTTTAQRIKDYGYVELSFADPLKKIAVALGFKKEEVYGTQDDKQRNNLWYGISGRTFLQKFGTDICRDYMPKILPQMCKPTLWISIMASTIANNGYKNVVISDGRFLDEAAFVKERDGIIIRVTRTKPYNWTNAPSHNETKHTSETEMQQIKPDHVILNDGTIDDLYDKIDDIMTHGLNKSTYWYKRWLSFNYMKRAWCKNKTSKSYHATMTSNELLESIFGWFTLATYISFISIGMAVMVSEITK